MSTPFSPRIGFLSLGCPKATVDSEHIVTRLRAEGYDVTPEYGDADLVVINTCGFIDAAVDESLDAIDEAMNANGRVIVTGCLGAKGDLVRDRFPDLLAVTGPHALQEVMSAVHTHLPARHDPFTSLIPPQGVRLTPRHYAYLKISEGCNHRCSFCIIPSMRGDLVSRPAGEVLSEAGSLVEAGVRELLIISQDTSAYGVDLRYLTDFWNGRPVRTRLTELADALGDLGAWVRLHYVYPYPHVDELIPLMAKGRVLPYLDVPLQHASPRILKAMRRPADAENTLQRIERWREICPEITLRSTFIVGFPGETEAEFEALLEFLDKAQLDRVGCFAYSPVEGASANELPEPVPDAVKLRRLDELMNLQSEISAAKLARQVGTVQTVMVDEIDGENGVTARTRGDAPEIDGRVLVAGADGAAEGDMISVRITGSDAHDLWAELAR
jgi:ribosomal protein S12 methylthiotransferase